MPKDHILPSVQWLPFASQYREPLGQLGARVVPSW